MRRSVVILFVLSLVALVTRAQSYSVNFDVETTAQMNAAMGIELAQEELTRERWGKILDHYGASEIAAAGIFASKYLDRLSLKDELSFGSEENWYYKHIRQMVAQRIMPKIFNVASMMIKHPDKAIYWGPYLFKTTEEVKQLCMIFQTVCSNGRLSFKDLHFLVIVDDLKELFDLSRFGGVDWKGMWDNISNLGDLSFDDLEDDFTNLMSVGGAIANAGGDMLDSLWIQGSKVGGIFHMKPKELWALGEEYANTFESLNSVEKVKDALMAQIESTDSIGVTKLFKFDEYNISQYVSNYLHQLTGDYYKQRWYIYWHESGRDLLDSWSPPIVDEYIINGTNGWYRINTNDANYWPDESVINATKAACASQCGWSQAKIDQMNAEQSWYHYYIVYSIHSYYIYRGSKDNIEGWSFSYDVHVYRTWNGGETVYEEEFDSYTMSESAFAQHMQSKLMEIKAQDEADNNSDTPLHDYKIGKDSKRYYSASNAQKMRGCTAVEFWLNCDNGAKLAEGATEWKVNRHLYDDEGPTPDKYKEEAMHTTLSSDGSDLQECRQKINDCNTKIAEINAEIAALQARQKELLDLISNSSYYQANVYREEYKKNKKAIEDKQAERSTWESALSQAQKAYNAAYGEYANESDDCYRIPAIMHDCEVNYGVDWEDEGHWEGLTYVRNGKINSMGVNVVFRGTVSNVRPEVWIDCLLFTLRIHRSILKISWELSSNYSTSDQVDVIAFSNDMSEQERSNIANQRQQELLKEHPDCSVEIRYQYSNNEVPEEDNGTYHLLWMSDRLRIAREVDMRLVRIHAELVLMERYLRHSQSILDYLATPFLDAYRQGMRGAMSNESYRRWRQSSIDALHSDRLDSIHQRRKPSQAPVRRTDVSSAALPPKETKPVEMNTPHEN